MGRGEGHPPAPRRPASPGSIPAARMSWGDPVTSPASPTAAHAGCKHGMLVGSFPCVPCASPASTGPPQAPAQPPPGCFMATVNYSPAPNPS